MAGGLRNPEYVGSMLIGSFRFYRTIASDYTINNEDGIIGVNTSVARKNNLKGD